MSHEVLKNYFKAREIVIATKHQKEKVIAPLLEQSFFVKCRVDNNLDTDQFGTFSGEVERQGSPLDTARRKIRATLKKESTSLAVASEGSFGPHPQYFFIPGDEELVLFYDQENDLEVKGHHITSDTNFSHSDIHHLSELKEFIAKAGFPSHGIILKAIKNPEPLMYFKEITDVHSLELKVADLLQAGYQVTAETDMRAHRNPTRMKAIEKATEQLAENLKKICPGCQIPGFAVTQHVPGLPCKWCQMPTRGIIKTIAKCQKCGYEKVVTDHSDQYQDPMYCDHCNP